MVRAIEEANHPEAQHGPAHLAILLRGPSRGIASLPWASRLVVNCDWLRRFLRSSPEDGLALGRASDAACPAVARVPAPSPQPGGGVLTHGPGACLGQMMVWRTCSSMLGSVALSAKDSFEGRLTR